MSSDRRRRSNRPISRELPADIVEQILLKLPAKHVLRCKLLSKTYHALIKDPRFIEKHLPSKTNDTIYVTRFLHNSKVYRPIVSLQCGTERYYKVYVPPDHETNPLQDVMLVGACNGLLCVQLVESYKRRHTIWNPITMEFLRIPSLSKLDCPGQLSCEPDVLGFGYDGDDYKLVRIRSYSLPNCDGQCDFFEGDVWAMRTNKWKKLGHVLPDLLLTKAHWFQSPVGLSIRGSLFWLAQNRRRRRDAVVLSFDMSCDVFRKIAMPHVWRDNRYYATINNFMGSLALIICPFYCEWTTYDVWVMMDESSSFWTKKFSIGPMSRAFRPTGASMNGYFVMKERRDKLCHFLLYDPHRNREEKCVLPSNGVYDSHYDYEPSCSSESLVSMKRHIEQRLSARRRIRGRK